MPRIKIELPDAFPFSTDIPIYIGHINYGHHLDNAQLMSLVSEARVRFFKFLGYTELDVEGGRAAARQVALGAGLLASAQAQTMDVKMLTLEGVRAIIAAAQVEARRLDAPGGAIAVVDDGGSLLALVLLALKPTAA